MFRFKQFSVDQTDCAMKINTDGVMLGLLADADNPQHMLDIGTGTGVIALMLAQRFHSAKVDAVEIDEGAAATAGRNFAASPFSDRLAVYAMGFEGFFQQHPDKKYELIVSNPPFYINSLLSPSEGKKLAKHADKNFFERMVAGASDHLTSDGFFWLILPSPAAEIIKEFASLEGLFLNRIINLKSFADDETHREILCFGRTDIQPTTASITLYKAVNVYTNQYKQLLQPFFINF